MCLEIKITANPKIAEKNILVYKELSSSNRPLHQAFKPYSRDLRDPYELDKFNPTVEIKTVWLGKYTLNPWFVIEEGYHSWKKRLFGNSGAHLFIIPKGTIYYEGKENGKRRGYVSETIIFVGDNTKENRKRAKEKYNV